MRKLSRIVLSLLALSALLLGAYLLADQLALSYFNQHLAWRLFVIPALTLLAGLGLGLGLGAGLRSRVPVKWLQREGLGLLLLAFALILGSSGFFRQSNRVSYASADQPIKDIFVYDDSGKDTVDLPIEKAEEKAASPIEILQVGSGELEPERGFELRSSTVLLPREIEFVDPSSQANPQQVVPVADRLEIPAWDVKAEVVRVPFEASTWDVSKIGQDIAQLGGIYGHENANNLVLAGHVSLPLQGFGPLRYLEKLRPGDSILVYSGQIKYQYEVRVRRFVPINEVSITYDTPSQQLTLVTCTAWNEDENSYENRLVVIADLISTTTISPPNLR